MTRTPCGQRPTSAWALATMGRVRRERATCDEDTLARPPGPGRGPPRHPGLRHQPRRRPGELGEAQAARDLDQDTLDRRRRVLGEDHPDTLTSASNLAVDAERRWGELQAARDLDQDTLRPPPPGPGRGPPRHPDLRQQPRHRPARRWASCRRPGTWTRTPYDRRRRVLGEDHPDTLTSASNLANDAARAGRAAGGPGPAPGHLRPPPPGPGRGPPRHPDLRQQPRRRPARAG